MTVYHAIYNTQIGIKSILNITGYKTIHKQYENNRIDIYSVIFFSLFFWYFSFLFSQTDIVLVMY